MNQQYRTTLLASIGAGLEYYDFIIYGLLASYLSTLFFPPHDGAAALIGTFAIFATGYLFRPIGGILFGMISDRYGRKKAFVSVMLLMALATCTIGLLPTYHQIGISAAYLLLLLRILQGLAFGAEIPGAITFVSEHANPYYRGTHCGFLVSSVGMGAVLASALNYFISRHFSSAMVLAWGWRIPFLIGSVLAIAGSWL